MQVQTPVKAEVKSEMKAEPRSPAPVSPVSQAREKERITTLLEINTLLLKEVVDLQTQGKGGHIGPVPPSQDGEQKQASKEFSECVVSVSHPPAFPG